MLPLIRTLWPDVYLYGKQREIVESVEDDDETVVVAGNELGKDFVAGLIVLAFFLTRHPCRIVTTSAKDDHLRVLWGEIGRFVRTAAAPLLVKDGGPLLLAHQSIRRAGPGGDPCPLSYCVGMVASPNTEAAMQGHHVADVGPGAGFTCCGHRVETPQARTLFLSDESSSVPDTYFKLVRTWAKRQYIFGNAWDCDNYFRHAVEGKPGTPDRGGDVVSPDGERYWRRVIRIRAEDSPNVRYGLAEAAAGREPSGRTLVPGVKGYARYAKQRATLDRVQQCVVLDARFYKGADVLLFPAEWLSLAERRWRVWDRDAAGGFALPDDDPRRLTPLPSRNARRATGVGADTAEGGDKTSFAAVDDYGLIRYLAAKTPDTSVIVPEAIAFGRSVGWSDPEEWAAMAFDRGGGGKQAADLLRSKGYPVRTVGFGEPITASLHQGRVPYGQRREAAEDRYVYKNRRAELWGELSLRLDPAGPYRWAVPPGCDELLAELLPVPKRYDSEGRLVLPPKHKRESGTDSDEKTLTELIGHSPDVADSFALACYAARTLADAPTAGPLLQNRPAQPRGRR